MDFSGYYKYIDKGQFAQDVPPYSSGGGVLKQNDTIIYPENLKSWRERIKLRLDATTPLTGTKFSVRDPGYRFATASRSPALAPPYGVYKVLTGWFQLTTCNPPNVSATDINLARGRFLEKCKGTQRPFMAGVFLGELRETLNMIRHPLSGLYKSQLLFSKRVKKLSERRLIFRTRQELSSANFATKRKKMGVLSDLWLESVYGWRPLLADIDDGISAISRYWYSIPTIHVVNHYETWDKSFLRNNTSVGPFTAIAETEHINRYQVRHSGAVKVYPQDVKTALGANYKSIGTLLDVVPTVWELIPYSFLIDYFVNVGEILEASTFIKSDLAWACEVTRSTNTVTQTVTPQSPGPGYSFIQYGSPFQASGTKFDRHSYSGAYVPTLSFHGPSFMHGINIAALAASFIASGVPPKLFHR
jgi:hypothetical protein